MPRHTNCGSHFKKRLVSLAVSRKRLVSRIDMLPLTQADLSGATVTEVMDTWTRQMGYPVFTVSQTTNTLTQTRFLAVQPEDPSSLVESPYKLVWELS